jgi:hypothetical protein
MLAFSLNIKIRLFNLSCLVAGCVLGRVKAS